MPLQHPLEIFNKTVCLMQSAVCLMCCYESLKAHDSQSDAQRSLTEPQDPETHRKLAILKLAILNFSFALVFSSVCIWTDSSHRFHPIDLNFVHCSLNTLRMKSYSNLACSLIRLHAAQQRISMFWPALPLRHLRTNAVTATSPQNIGIEEINALCKKIHLNSSLYFLHSFRGWMILDFLGLKK